MRFDESALKFLREAITGTGLGYPANRVQDVMVYRVNFLSAELLQ